MAIRHLTMLAEKVVQPAINPKHLAYCPTMDLIAFATVDDQVHVHRLNGQRVFGVSGKQSLGEVKSIEWKPNGRNILTYVICLILQDRSVTSLRIILGQIIAVAFQDNHLYLTNAHTGKVIYQVKYATHPDSQICYVGWSINSTNDQVLDRPFNGLGPDMSLDDLLKRGNPSINDKEPPDLPSDLAFLEVEAMLPKLSPLSTGGSEYGSCHSEISATRSNVLYIGMTFSALDHLLTQSSDHRTKTPTKLSTSSRLGSKMVPSASVSMISSRSAASN